MTTVEKSEALPIDIAIRRAKDHDLPEILTLLEACQLPREGLAAHLSTTLVARTYNEIVGCAALELYQQLALLRSVAVKPSFRKRGLGFKLTSAALGLARESRVTNVYLLTETAAAFFSKLGFVKVQRSDVPKAVKRSVEFTALCPETATVMTMPLARPFPCEN